MKSIILLCLVAFIASLIWMPVVSIYVTVPFDSRKPFWEINHADHVQWGVLFLEWGLIAVMGFSARMLAK